jgi:triosephosphate isomerase (TIM)
MTLIFVNLKRFDVPRSAGGICPSDDPAAWAADVVNETVRSGQAARGGIEVLYLLPEALVLPAVAAARSHPAGKTTGLHIGCQGVFREDITPGGNFGAFTTNLPAAAARTLGAEWAIVGHSEERKDKLGIMTAYDPSINSDAGRREAARAAVDGLLNAEAHRALGAGLDVLFCVGETEEETSEVEATLEAQVRQGLDGLGSPSGDRRVVIGYEPIWAIGPGKTPPDGEYIGFAADVIKRAGRKHFGIDIPVVYGGGLKEANAAEIGAVPQIDGGLVALTRFTEPIGFDPADLIKIIDGYTAAAGNGDA